MNETAAVLRASGASKPLKGVFRPPGDKSISHRALILATLADGASRIEGLLKAADIEATASACRALGADVESRGASCRVNGVGMSGLREPQGPLDMGNSGTAMRLLAGVLAAQPFDSVLVGDQSLMRRPMSRIAAPLREMGASVNTAPDGCAPLEIEGGHSLRGITWRSPVASAQVKSCILLAGLYAQGSTRVIEPTASRDHTERMLRVFGAELPDTTTVRGGGRLSGANLSIPADISSAAFFLAAGALVPGSTIRLVGVGLNPGRAGIVDALRKMGCDLRISESNEHGGEPAGDLEVCWTGNLRGINLQASEIPAIIDELPILMVVAALAKGVTRIRGAEELRFKESDRIAVMAAGLETLGIPVRQFPDGVDIDGCPELIMAGGETIELDAVGDHRCAMSFCVLAQGLGREIRIRGAAEIGTSYPGFVSDLRAIGGSVHAEEEEANA